jgi:CRP-like cAMP-binding protein
LLHKLAQWRELTGPERAAVLALPHSVATTEPRRHIIRQGSTSAHACLLISGFAFREKIVVDGSRSISSIHMRGDVVNLQNSLVGVANHSVQALTRCKVALVPRDAVAQLAFAFPNIGMALWYDTLVQASMFREWIASIARRNARARIAHLLCEFGVRLEAAGLGSKVNYQLPMSQEHLGDCVGLTPVHVNRTLKDLEASGDITRSKRDVAIADWAKISRTAGFEDDYLQLASRTMTRAFV